MLSKITRFVKDNQNDTILVIGVVLISLISFGAGRLTSQTAFREPMEKTANIMEANGKTGGEAVSATPTALPIQIIGNKNSKLYHYPWCSGAKNMKEENKAFFDSTEEAQKAGYRPAGNCPGLQ